MLPGRHMRLIQLSSLHHLHAPYVYSRRSMGCLCKL
ncbi:hypothetical protein Goarm_022643, partial [Gossypium armourianum]|nr:hypothetical protein [Gossypium armourianum]